MTIVTITLENEPEKNGTPSIGIVGAVTRKKKRKTLAWDKCTSQHAVVL